MATEVFTIAGDRAVEIGIYQLLATELFGASVMNQRRVPFRDLFERLGVTAVHVEASADTVDYPLGALADLRDGHMGLERTPQQHRRALEIEAEAMAAGICAVIESRMVISASSVAGEFRAGPSRLHQRWSSLGEIILDHPNFVEGFNSRLIDQARELLGDVLAQIAYEVAPMLLPEIMPSR